MARSLRRQLAQLALDGRDVALLARDGRPHLADPVLVLLVVALVAEALGLAVVEILLHLGEALLLVLQLVLEDPAGVAVARALRDGIGPAHRRAGAHRRAACRTRLRRLDDRERRAVDALAAETLGLARTDRVLVVVVRAAVHARRIDRTRAARRRGEAAPGAARRREREDPEPLLHRDVPAATTHRVTRRRQRSSIVADRRAVNAARA